MRFWCITVYITNYCSINFSCNLRLCSTSCYFELPTIVNLPILVKLLTFYAGVINSLFTNWAKFCTEVCPLPKSSSTPGIGGSLQCRERLCWHIASVVASEPSLPLADVGGIAVSSVCSSSLQLPYWLLGAVGSNTS